MDFIYAKTLKLDPTAAKDATAVTHISTDIDRVISGLENSDVLRASSIKVALAIYILSDQIGLARIAPVGISLGE